MTETHTVALFEVLRAWQLDKAAQRCPACGGTGLEIKDLSARPHTEWYRFTCTSCGLNETMAVPYPASGPSGIN